MFCNVRNCVFVNSPTSLATLLDSSELQELIKMELPADWEHFSDDLHIGEIEGHDLFNLDSSKVISNLHVRESEDDNDLFFEENSSEEYNYSEVSFSCISCTVVIKLCRRDQVPMIQTFD